VSTRRPPSLRGRHRRCERDRTRHRRGRTRAVSPGYGRRQLRSQPSQGSGSRCLSTSLRSAVGPSRRCVLCRGSPPETVGRSSRPSSRLACALCDLALLIALLRDSRGSEWVNRANLSPPATFTDNYFTRYHEFGSDKNWQGPRDAGEATRQAQRAGRPRSPRRTGG
jgi:hypothetical protein